MGFAEKVMPYSAFVNDILRVEPAGFQKSGETATFHSPCHLCRGLGIRSAPHELIEKAGFEFVKAEEEETCCGFGGTYSGKFPAISAEILNKKLDDVQKTCAAVLITECPGCILQLRGGGQKRGDAFQVKHISEIVAKHIKK